MTTFLSLFAFTDVVFILNRLVSLPSPCVDTATTISCVSWASVTPSFVIVAFTIATSLPTLSCSFYYLHRHVEPCQSVRICKRFVHCYTTRFVLGVTHLLSLCLKVFIVSLHSFVAVTVMPVKVLCWGMPLFVPVTSPLVSSIMACCQYACVGFDYIDLCVNCIIPGFVCQLHHSCADQTSDLFVPVFS